MARETIVAVYDTTERGHAAIRDLVACGVPQSDVEGHDENTLSQRAAAKADHDGSFWSRLFGGGADRDREVYDRSVKAGGHVVSVNCPEEDAEAVMTIMDRHDPVDIDERAAGYGQERSEPSRAPATGGDRMEVAEERLEVGKRPAARGTTRLRRYVVETPVEETVALRDERVRVERHPVDRSTTAGDAAFTEKTIEATEVHEEPVVEKKARVVEEVGLRKEAGERVETVRDTVRRDEVEVDRKSDDVPPRR